MNNFYRLSEDTLLDEIRERKQRDDWLGIDLASDGQYDSPGFSSMACCVSAPDIESKKILTYDVVYKDETG